MNLLEIGDKCCEALCVVIGFCLEDFSLSCFVAHGVGNTAGVYHACELHAGETCCKHLGKHEFVEGITSVVDVDFFGSAHREGENELLAFEGSASGTVREAVKPYFFHPSLEQTGDAEPEKWELEDYDVGFDKALLLTCHIDGLVGVEICKTNDFCFGKCDRKTVENLIINYGIFGVGMTANDKNFRH